MLETTWRHESSCKSKGNPTKLWLKKKAQMKGWREERAEPVRQTIERGQFALSGESAQLRRRKYPNQPENHYGREHLLTYLCHATKWRTNYTILRRNKRRTHWRKWIGLRGWGEIRKEDFQSGTFKYQQQKASSRGKRGRVYKGVEGKTAT